MERTNLIRFREPRRAEPSGRGIARDAGPPLVPTECCGTLPVCLMSSVRERCGPSYSIGRTRDAGKHKSLYQYLENRYPNTVVLTFAQIEDLIGFTLPDSASSCASPRWTCQPRTGRAADLMNADRDWKRGIRLASGIEPLSGVLRPRKSGQSSPARRQVLISTACGGSCQCIERKPDRRSR